MMGFTKYQKTESTKVVSPKGHKAASEALKKTGKSSMRDLSEDERKSVARSVDSA